MSAHVCDKLGTDILQGTCFSLHDMDRRPLQFACQVDLQCLPFSKHELCHRLRRTRNNDNTFRPSKQQNQRIQSANCRSTAGLSCFTALETAVDAVTQTDVGRVTCSDCGFHGPCRAKLQFMVWQISTEPVRHSTVKALHKTMTINRNQSIQNRSAQAACTQNWKSGVKPHSLAVACPKLLRVHPRHHALPSLYHCREWMRAGLRQCSPFLFWVV